MKKPTPQTNKVKNGLHKRGDNWCIRLMVNGELIRKTIGPDKAKAQAVLDELKSKRSLYRATGEMAGIEAMFKKKERKTFAEVAALYMEDRPHLKASTKRGYEEILKNYLLPAFGKVPVEQITEDAIARFQATISTKVSATRTNNIMGPLRYILKVCVRRKLITENPALNVDRLREEEPDINPLSNDELDAVIAALHPHQRPLFLCLAWTGARPDELFALRWHDVSFERNEITISKGRVRGKEGTTKTRSSNRIVHTLSVVKETLLALKQAPTVHLDGYVFLTKKGQPYDKHVDREWRTALKKAGVHHRPSYQLRHTFASICLQNGAQPTWVAKMLGHSTPQITFKHYARFIDDSSSFNENKLESYIKAKDGNRDLPA